MKKKKWYELLEKYNEIIDGKRYNANMIDENELSEVKENIKNYVEKMLPLASLEAEDIIRDYKVKGYRQPYIEEKYLKSRPVKWSKKADAILAALKEEQAIDEECLKDSFYEILYYGIFTEKQLCGLIAIVILVYLAIRIMQQ